MITPAYSITATERILPRLALDFSTALLDSRVTVARAANTATRINAAGVIELVNADLPRFTFDPVSLVCRGIMREDARTNLLLNSLIDGTNLATQSVTVAATAYTLSFYGSGQVVLSGTHSATVAGTGDYPARRTYTFTPTAGSLTLTVTGDVKFSNLEAGAFATSFIPTAGASVLRNADIISMTGTNFSGWFNQPQGSLLVEADTYATGGIRGMASISDGTTSNCIELRLVALAANDNSRFLVTTLGGASCSLTGPAAVIPNTMYRLIGTYKQDSFAAARNSTFINSDVAGNLPSVNRMNIGAISDGGSGLNGVVKKIMYWPQRLTDSELRSFSK
jgi:hypothetical protein